MRLKDYLSEQKLTYTDFARRVGVRSQSIKRYAEDGRVPIPSVMTRVVEETGGAVQPNDFFVPQL